MNGATKTCSTCGHGLPMSLPVGAVECREGPPQVIVVPGQGLAAEFPKLYGTASCGRWIPKPVQLAGTGETATKTAEKPAGGSNGKA